MAFDWRGEEFAARIRVGAEKGMVDATELVREEMIRLIRDPPKSGKIYRRRGVRHQASAPGEAPANWTGHLVASISTDYNFAENNLIGNINVSAKYAGYLEFGTRKMMPRPFAQRAVDSKRVEAHQAVINAIRMAMG